ncbi:MAG: alpha/beta fold hydrolase [Thermoanaerobaculia bacterium]
MASIPRSAVLTLGATLLTGCTLHRLPTPAVPSCAPTTTASLWECIESIPREDRPESGFQSTVRISDAGRKRRDQTYPSACEGPTPAGFVLERIGMEAGRAPLVGFIAPPLDGSTPIVLVVHGLFDSKNTKYVQVTGDLMRSQGFGVVIPDMRGHGCLLSRQWLPTLGIEEGPDLLAWGRWLAKKYPGHPIGLVGFSLGGLSALHAIGQPEAESVFTAGAVAVCPAADLPRVVQHLDAKLFFSDSGYTVFFRKGFRSYVRKRAKGLRTESDGSFAGSLKAVVAARPELGPTPEEFLARADPAPSVASSRRPLLILVTSNDPILPISSVADLGRAAEGNRFAHLIETPFGGHIGQPGSSPHWFATVLATFFRYAATAAE